MKQAQQNYAVISKIRQALTKLTKQKTFDELSVSEIVKECGFSRQYFYRFFTDKFSPIDKIVRDDIKHAMSSGIFLGKNGAENFFNVFYEQRFLYRACIASSFYFETYQLFFRMGKDFLYALVESTYFRKPTESEMSAIEFYISAVVTIFLRWLTDGNIKQAPQLSAMFLNGVPSELKALSEEEVTADHIMYKLSANYCK